MRDSKASFLVRQYVRLTLTPEGRPDREAAIREIMDSLWARMSGSERREAVAIANRCLEY